MISKFFTFFTVVIAFSMIISACSGEPVDDPMAAEGKKLVAANCLGCHPIDPSQPRIGPDLVGLSDRLTASGNIAVAVLEESIRQPGKEIAPGYQDLMPSADLLGLGDEEIEAIITYLGTLTEQGVE